MYVFLGGGAVEYISFTMTFQYANVKVQGILLLGHMSHAGN